MKTQTFLLALIFVVSLIVAVLVMMGLTDAAIAVFIVAAGVVLGSILYELVFKKRS